jgi:hypothetical protein
MKDPDNYGHWFALLLTVAVLVLVIIGALHGL